MLSPAGIKKTYSITEEGIGYFKENLNSPMLYKEKNMELSKLFFRGFADDTQHSTFINQYIKELEDELVHLESINKPIKERYQFSKADLFPI